MAKSGAERLFEPAQVFFIVGGVRQMNVDGRWRLVGRIVVRLMERDGKHLKLPIPAGVNWRTDFVDVAAAGACAGQRMAQAGFRRKDSGSAVAVVNVQVDGHGPVQPAIFMHTLDGYSDVMNHAEPFAMIGERMMKASADV